MLLPITNTARKYGYIIWSKKNTEFAEMLKGLDYVDVYFNGLNIGKKKIDWKHNRISIGYKFTRALPDNVKNYSITIENKSILRVECEQ